MELGERAVELDLGASDRPRPRAASRAGSRARRGWRPPRAGSAAGGTRRGGWGRRRARGGTRPSPARRPAPCPSARRRRSGGAVRALGAGRAGGLAGRGLGDVDPQLALERGLAPALERRDVAGQRGLGRPNRWTASSIRPISASVSPARVQNAAWVRASPSKYSAILSSSSASSGENPLRRTIDSRWSSASRVRGSIATTRRYRSASSISGRPSRLVIAARSISSATRSRVSSSGVASSSIVRSRSSSDS